MPTLRDKLRSVQSMPRCSTVSRPVPQDCYVRETFLALPERASIADGILSLMQGDLSIPHHTDPAEMLFLDTETTGLSHGAGTVAFLVGTGRIDGKGIRVHQYLMRDYDEETFVLKRVLSDLDKCSVLVTYNGRSFDMPLLQSRCIMNRISHDFSTIPHADILYTARRVFKLRLRDCRLSALEETVFHAPRADDLPGSEVPQRYFDYLQKHDFSLLEDILAHNAQDIASLARLTFLLAGLHSDPLTAEHLQDIYSLGRVFDRRGKAHEARVCYRAADAGSMSGLSRIRLAENLKKSGRAEDAVNVYIKMIRAHQGGAGPYIAMSKLLEHRLKNIPAAARTAMDGIRFVADMPDTDENRAALEDLKGRYARLFRKMEKRPHDI